MPHRAPQLESYPDWKIALVLTMALRIFYSALAAALSFVLHPAPSLIHSNALTENLPAPGSWHYALVGIWERFDTLWYMRIAQHGYDRPMAVIFYPLYPATIHAASWLLPPIVSALLVSTGSAFFFCWGMLRLASEELSAAGRIRMLAFVAAWPASFVFFAGYAESLTAALIVWAVVFARNSRWELAATCGLLAGLARPSGVLVAVPLLVLAWRSSRARSLIVLLTPVGTVGYWAWLRWTGRPAVVEAYRRYQGMPFAPPWDGLWDTLRMIAHGNELLALKFGLIVVAAAFALRPPNRLEDKLFAAAILLQMFMYTGRPNMGAARYLLLIYPAFVGLAAYAEKRWGPGKFGFYLSALGLLNLAWMVGFLQWSLVL